jgi:hypothetical protein
MVMLFAVQRRARRRRRGLRKGFWHRRLPRLDHREDGQLLIDQDRGRRARGQPGSDRIEIVTVDQPRRRTLEQRKLRPGL